MYRSITGTIFLQKKVDFKKSLLVKKLDSLGLLSSLSFMPKISDGYITAWETTKNENTLEPSRPASGFSFQENRNDTNHQHKKR